MIYYPLSVLMLAGIKEILIISTPHDLPYFRELFGDGSQLGLHLEYAEQPRPEGLAQAFLIGKAFIGKDPVALILGDNIFFGPGFSHIVKDCAKLTEGGNIFGYLVKDPQRYGVVEFDRDNNVVSIAEKVRPSARGELEITDINMEYLRRGTLKVSPLGRGFCWLDTGTHESLQQASSYVQAVQDRQGLKVACIEEIAYQLGYISIDQLASLASGMLKNQYGRYIMDIVSELTAQSS
jgi:glucose-1-phosphate thymidylyltransferase